MEKSYKSLVNLMVYAIALIAVAYALAEDIRVPLWAVVLFIVVVIAVSMIRNRSRRIRVEYSGTDLSPVEKLRCGDSVDLRASETITFNKGDRIICFRVSDTRPKIVFESGSAPASKSTEEK